ncbi:hypothetical protein WG66_015868 [Moniliophthora roreri]|nr:hypothetical protein WG66_015868 [Moniliophthora roreri]
MVQARHVYYLLVVFVKLKIFRRVRHLGEDPDDGSKPP